ncbi:MAG TPA: aconitate hydratase [Bacteroidales bacterium]|nr:aconitate hydratase [Bacteroidales bacterium]
MILDLKITESFYRTLPEKIHKIRKQLGHPLTLSEKIFYSHLMDQSIMKPFRRGIDYMEFSPDRVAMQDATAQMSLLQLMTAGREQVSVPSSIHCDHLITGRSGSDEDLKTAMKQNREVYDFLRSACDKYSIDFWEPGSGIIHQIIFENYAFPGGMIIGADSHTPNAGGLGMIAIGTGGADALDVMTGLGWELRLPEIIGIRLTGKLNGWTSAKDVIMKITGMLTVKGGTDSVIEYFGEGAESLSATGKATICNMGAETGATCSIFGFDNAMAEYLTATGRNRVAELAGKNKDHLVSDPEVPDKPDKYFDRYFEINLSDLEPHINGPFTPDRATPVSGMKEEALKNNWPVEVEAGLIGSCTNSSYEDMARAASVIRDALVKKLDVKSDLLVTPGSEQIKIIAERDGFLDTFRNAGGVIFANACGPCIGQWERKGADKKRANSIIHSFNRNFSGRTDGNPLTHAFIGSPEIVAAIAVAGNLNFNPVTDVLKNSEGKDVKLSEPEGLSLPLKGFGKSGRGLLKPLSGNKKKELIIDPDSERLQLLNPFAEWEGSDLYTLPLLIKTRGKCTTDHISAAGKWLKYRGHLENISGNYMIGAVNYFNNLANSVLNQLTGEYAPVPEVAVTYRDSGAGSIVAGEENFGEGSSREHAAMEARFLGVRALLVKSFARIHETNLKKQGVLTLTFSDREDYNKVREDDKIDITGLTEFFPGRQLNVRLNHADGSFDEFPVNHSYNEKQISWFKAGSALNFVRKSK